jgi:hypothetical protein
MGFWLEVGLFKDQNFGFDPDFINPATAMASRKGPYYEEFGLFLAHKKYRQFVDDDNTFASDLEAVAAPMIPTALLWSKDTNNVDELNLLLILSGPTNGPARNKYLDNSHHQNGLAITIHRVLLLAYYYIFKDAGNSDHDLAKATFTAMTAANDAISTMRNPPKYARNSFTCIAQLLLFVLTGGDERPAEDTYAKRNFIYRAFVNFAGRNDRAVKARVLPKVGGRTAQVYPPSFAHGRYGGREALGRSGGWGQTHDGTWMPLNLPA